MNYRKNEVFREFELKPSAKKIFPKKTRALTTQRGKSRSVSRKPTFWLIAAILVLILSTVILQDVFRPGIVSAAPPLPPAVQHLYVGNNSLTGGISQFDLPLTPSSTPNFTILSVNSIISVATDSQGNLAAGTLGSQIYYFIKPLSGASTPSASFSTGGLGAYQLAFVPCVGFPPPPDQLS